MRLSVVCVLVFFCGCASAEAVMTSIWHETAQADLQKGEFEGMACTQEGKLHLSPGLAEVEGVKSVFVWALSADSEGNIYAATGDEGLVWKIDPQGQAAVLCDLPDPHVTSIAADRDGDVYAGASPGGVIYKILASGAASVFVDTPETYVWALAVDRNGDLVAGTGNGGKIYHISPDGKYKVLYDPGETHIMCLMLDADGSIYAGSERNGIVYRLTEDGEPFVLYDAVEGEVRSIVKGPDGCIYAATASGGEQMALPVGMPSAPMPPQKPQPGPDADGDEGGESFLQTLMLGMGQGPVFHGPQGPGVVPEAPVGANSVYKIDFEGAGRRIFSADNTVILSLAAGEDGSIYAGTGNEGRIYRILPDETWTLLVEADEAQVVSMVRCAGGEIIAGTGNMGKIFRMGSAFAPEGTFTSRVFDTNSVSRWGDLWWAGEVPDGTSIELSTRTGNDERPGPSWSKWSGKNTDPAGKKIESPSARFIQYQVRMETSDGRVTPVLREVSAAYTAKNQPPLVRSVVIDGQGQVPGMEQQAPGPHPGMGMMMPPDMAPPPNMAQPPQPGIPPATPGTKTVSWTAEDPNADTLSFAIHFRGEGETAWKLIEKDIEEPEYTLDATALPDGRYLVKVSVSDRRSNPSGQELTAEKASEPFIVDNTPPVVENVTAAVKGNKALIEADIRDATSRVREAAYAVDGGEWFPLGCGDGVCDSGEEKVSFEAGELAAGEHLVVVRAVDFEGNTGAGKVVINITGD